MDFNADRVCRLPENVIQFTTFYGFCCLAMLLKMSLIMFLMCYFYAERCCMK